MESCLNMYLSYIHSGERMKKKTVGRPEGQKPIRTANGGVLPLTSWLCVTSGNCFKFYVWGGPEFIHLQ